MAQFKPNINADEVVSNVLAYVAAHAFGGITPLQREEITARVLGHSCAHAYQRYQRQVQQFLVFALNEADIEDEKSVVLSKTLEVMPVEFSALEEARRYASEQAAQHGFSRVILNGAYEQLEIVDEPFDGADMQFMSPLGQILDPAAETLQELAEDHTLLDIGWQIPLRWAIGNAKRRLRESTYIKHLVIAHSDPATGLTSILWRSPSLQS